jgi:hypothetical protein
LDEVRFHVGFVKEGRALWHMRKRCDE